MASPRSGRAEVTRPVYRFLNCISMSNAHLPRFLSRFWQNTSTRPSWVWTNDHRD